MPGLAQAAAAAADTASVEAIVVTARHRQEKLQDVPVALSVLGGADLEATNTSNIRELFQQVPSLNVLILNPRNTAPIIRGIGSTLANDGLVNSVGVFVDGVYYARPGAASFELPDLERVEVLRGPQGTLFGKNTTAGALNIVSRAPQFAPETTALLTGGSYGTFKARITTTGPITDDLAFRLSGSVSRHDGFVRNLRTGQQLNDFRDENLRGQLLWRPTDNFNVRLIADYEDQKLDCCVDIPVRLETTRANGTPIPNSFAVRARLFNYTLPPIDPFDRHTDIDSPQKISTSQHGLSAEANWDLGGFTLTSITAWRYWKFSPYSDFDLTGLPVLLQGAIFSSQNQYSQELRIASPTGGRIDYIAGLYYFNETLHSNGVQLFGSAAGGWILPALPLAATTGALDQLTLTIDQKPKTKSYATFGQATWHVTDKLDLTGGLRYTQEDKQGYLRQSIFGGAAIETFPAASQPLIRAIRAGIGPPSFSFSATHSEGNWSGTAGASYHVTPDVLAYASYARGYKSGGVNFTVLPAGANQLIDPEIADDYEVGLKTQLFDHLATFNLAAYWTTVKGFQSNRITTTDAGALVLYIANAGEVRSRGVEFDATATPRPGLRLRASGAFTDATYTSYKNAPCPLEQANLAFCDLTGLRVPDASRWSGFAGARYETQAPLFHLAGGGVNGFVDSDISYRSSYYGQTSRFTKVPAYAVINLRLGLTSEDRRTELEAWVRNLADRNYYTLIAVTAFNTGLIQGELGDPRTYGLTLRRTF